MGLLVILWNILKVIGIIVLFVLLLILLIIVLVLFTPICYKVAGSYTEDVNGEFDVKWILGAIHAYGMYEKGDLRISLRLFGYCIYGADKKQKKKKQEIEYTQEDTVITARSKPEQQQEVVEQQIKQQSKINENEVNELNESEINERKETKTEKVEQQQKESAEEIKQKHSRKKVSDIKTDKKRKKQHKKKKVKNKENKKQGIDKSYFLHMENKKELLQAVMKFCKRILKGVLPKHCCLKATVGTGDPALTGYLLGIAGATKMKFGKGLQITGDFTQKILKDVFLDIKGKILLGYLLYAVLRLLFVKPVYKTIMVIWKGYR